MLSLAEIQGAMRDAVIAAPARRLIGEIVSDRIPAQARLRVYRNHYRVSLEEGLARVFPATRLLLGGRYFDTMTSLFITTCPPRDARIGLYGGDLPHFLATREELEESLYAVEVARLEWLLAFVAEAADEAPLGGEGLARAVAGPESCRLHLARRLALFDGEWPAHAIRRAAVAGDGVEALAALLQTPAPTRLLLHRDADGDPCETVLDQGSWAALYALRGGRTVAEAARRAQTAAPGYQPDELLAFLFRSGLVTGLSFTPAPQSGAN